MSSLGEYCVCERIGEDRGKGRQFLSQLGSWWVIMQYYLENHLKGFKLQNDSVETPSFHSSQTVFLESQRNLALVRSRYNTYPGWGGQCELIR